MDGTKHRLLLMMGLLALAATTLAPSAAAQGQPDLVVEGRSTDCPSGKSLCFEVTQGDLEQVLTPGAEVTLKFINAQANSGIHNVYLAPLADADDGHSDTPSEAAYASTETIQPGESVTINFTVPDTAEDTYLWCDVPGHESAGMWLATAEMGGGNGGGNGMPGFTMPVALAGVAVALLLVRLRD